MYSVSFDVVCEQFWFCSAAVCQLEPTAEEGAAGWAALLSYQAQSSAAAAGSFAGYSRGDTSIQCLHKPVLLVLSSAFYFDCFDGLIGAALLHIASCLDVHLSWKCIRVAGAIIRHGRLCDQCIAIG